MKMRFKFRVKAALQFIAFAFYPKTTLIACAVFSAVVIAVLGVVMSFIPHDSNWYNLVFALTTGATGSFFVSFIVELANNYRHNKLAWHELQDYYSIVTDYESTKQVLMQHYPSQRAEKRAHDEFAAAGGMEELDEEDQPKDLIQATWEQIPKIIPVLKKTLDEKKEFLSDGEIIELKNIMADFSEIRSELKTLIMLSPLLHNVLNHPDEEILSNYYSKNVLADMPEWIRNHISSSESQASMERLIDAILADDFLLTYFMKDYDISQHGLDSYQSPFDEEDYEPEELNADDYDFSEHDNDLSKIHDTFGPDSEDYDADNYMDRLTDFWNDNMSDGLRKRSSSENYDPDKDQEDKAWSAYVFKNTPWDDSENTNLGSIAKSITQNDLGRSL